MRSGSSFGSRQLRLPVRHAEAAVQARRYVALEFFPAAEAFESGERRVRQIDRRERQFPGARCERFERDIETRQIARADALEAVPLRLRRVRRPVPGPVDAALVLAHAGADEHTAGDHEDDADAGQQPASRGRGRGCRELLPQALPDRPAYPGQREGQQGHRGGHAQHAQQGRVHPDDAADDIDEGGK